MIAALLQEKLRAVVQYVPGRTKIRKVAVCCGSGGEFHLEAKTLGCDALLTGEARYHDFIDAQASGIGLFACGHFETEAGICRVLQQRLRSKFPELPVFVSDRLNPIITVNENGC